MGKSFFSAYTSVGKRSLSTYLLGGGLFVGAVSCGSDPVPAVVEKANGDSEKIWKERQEFLELKNNDLSTRFDEAQATLREKEAQIEKTNRELAELNKNVNADVAKQTEDYKKSLRDELGKVKSFEDLNKFVKSINFNFDIFKPLEDQGVNGTKECVNNVIGVFYQELERRFPSALFGVNYESKTKKITFDPASLDTEKKLKESRVSKVVSNYINEVVQSYDSLLGYLDKENSTSFINACKFLSEKLRGGYNKAYSQFSTQASKIDLAINKTTAFLFDGTSPADCVAKVAFEVSAGGINVGNVPNWDNIYKQMKLERAKDEKAFKYRSDSERFAEILESSGTVAVANRLSVFNKALLEYQEKMKQLFSGENTVLASRDEESCKNAKLMSIRKTTGDHYELDSYFSKELPELNLLNESAATKGWETTELDYNKVRDEEAKIMAKTFCANVVMDVFKNFGGAHTAHKYLDTSKDMQDIYACLEEAYKGGDNGKLVEFKNKFGNFITKAVINSLRSDALTQVVEKGGNNYKLSALTDTFASNAAKDAGYDAANHKNNLDNFFRGNYTPESIAAYYYEKQKPSIEKIVSLLTAPIEFDANGNLTYSAAGDFTTKGINDEWKGIFDARGSAEKEVEKRIKKKKSEGEKILLKSNLFRLLKHDGATFNNATVITNAGTNSSYLGGNTSVLGAYGVIKEALLDRYVKGEVDIIDLDNNDPSSAAGGKLLLAKVAASVYNSKGSTLDVAAAGTVDSIDLTTVVYQDISNLSYAAAGGGGVTNGSKLHSYFSALSGDEKDHCKIKLGTIFVGDGKLCVVTSDNAIYKDGIVFKLGHNVGLGNNQIISKSGLSAVMTYDDKTLSSVLSFIGAEDIRGDFAADGGGGEGSDTSVPIIRNFNLLTGKLAVNGTSLTDYKIAAANSTVGALAAKPITLV